MGGRIAVGVSGGGSNLRALAARIDRGALDAEIVLVFADRPCAALDWATEAGIDTALIEDLGAPIPDTRALADARGVKAGVLIHPTRVAVVGRAESPGIFEVLELMGRDRALTRMGNALRRAG